MKPLFIPLKGKYFEQFEQGKKKAEFRAYGARWNEKTCPAGRAVTLSYGYGKARRLHGFIISAYECAPSKDFVEIYGEGKRCFAIEIGGLHAL